MPQTKVPAFTPNTAVSAAEIASSVMGMLYDGWGVMGIVDDGWGCVGGRRHTYSTLVWSGATTAQASVYKDSSCLV
eukprot:356637-Chlamydomonas_euryale.AAC.1